MLRRRRLRRNHHQVRAQTNSLRNAAVEGVEGGWVEVPAVACQSSNAVDDGSVCTRKCGFSGARLIEYSQSINAGGHLEGRLLRRGRYHPRQIALDGVAHRPGGQELIAFFR